jgi:hypothetical protein
MAAARPYGRIPSAEPAPTVRAGSFDPLGKLEPELRMILARHDPLMRLATLVSIPLLLWLCNFLTVEPLAAPRAQEPAGPFDHEHALWTDVVKEHVRGDRFDYQGLIEDRGKLDRYLQALHAVTPAELEGWKREQQMAFWINVYNAHIVHLVASNYPLENIKDLGGLFSPVWKKEFIAMGAFDPDGKGEKLSLDEVEHEILRKRYPDARVHAAVNCASVSCPPLRAEAYVGERLQEQLDEMTRAWLADPSRNRFEPEKGRARVSAVFKWFREDFERDGGSLRKWLAKYAPPEAAEWLETAKKVDIDHLDYDWSLNDLPRPKR